MPASDLNLLCDAARASGEIALRFWQQTPESWIKPGDAGPVTEADLTIDRMLHSELQAARPDYGWLSEETEDSKDRLNNERIFIVDPIDGTRAFINGERSFSHSLAIAENGVVTAAAVYLPVPDLMFTATRSGRAQLNDVNISATHGALENARVLSNKRDFMDDRWTDGVPPIERHFRPSLAYRLCLVAQGRFDAMFTLRPTWEWDVAAGSLIAEQAGAQVSQRDGATPRFNNRVPQLNGLVAANATRHEDIIRRLK